MTDRVLFSGKRAIGVAYLQHGERVSAHVRREVLVCSGAIASPQLLQRSGVGRSTWLREFDIPLVHDLPGVGENLQDHLEMYMQYECKEPVSLYPALQWWNQPAIGLEWMLNGTGIGASNQFEAGGFIRTRDDDLWPNIQYHFLPVAINYNGSNPIKMHGFQAHVGSMRSPSRGRVKLKSRDPNAHPSILFNYMSDPLDWREFRDGIRITREIMRQPALEKYRGRELHPGADLDDRRSARRVRSVAGGDGFPSVVFVQDGVRRDGRRRWRGARAWGGSAARRRCVDHAADHDGQPERADDHAG